MVRIVGNYVYEVYMVYMHDAIKFYIMLWKFIKMLNGTIQYACGMEIQIGVLLFPIYFFFFS